MRKIWLLLTAILLLAAVPAALAQNKQKKGEDQTRSVKGVVNSADGQTVQGAVVQLKNTKTLQIRSFISKEDGTYYFLGLSPDVDYELRAEFQGGSSSPKSLTSFDSRKEAIVNLKLNPKK